MRWLGRDVPDPPYILGGIVTFTILLVRVLPVP